MRLHIFIMIAMGVMYMFSLGGIETNSSKIFDTLLNDNNVTNTNVEPDTSVNASEAVDIINKSNSNWWSAINLVIIFLVGFSVVSSIKLFGSGIDATGLITAAAAGMAFVIYSVFVGDMWSILVTMYNLSGGIGWEYHLTLILILPFTVLFTFDLVRFVIGRSD